MKHVSKEQGLNNEAPKASQLLPILTTNFLTFPYILTLGFLKLEPYLS